jgi:hypothetical protein
MSHEAIEAAALLALRQYGSDGEAAEPLHQEGKIGPFAKSLVDARDSRTDALLASMSRYLLTSRPGTHDSDAPARLT